MHLLPISTRNPAAWRPYPPTTAVGRRSTIGPAVTRDMQSCEITPHTQYRVELHTMQDSVATLRTSSPEILTSVTLSQLGRTASVALKPAVQSLNHRRIGA